MDWIVTWLIWLINDLPLWIFNDAFFKVFSGEWIVTFSQWMVEGFWIWLLNLIDSVPLYFLAYTGCAMSVFCSVFGSANGILTVGTLMQGACVKKPRVRTKNLVSILFCEAISIYGLIFAILLLNKIGEVEDLTTKSAHFGAYAIFFSGFGVGLGDLVAALAVGTCGSAIVLADAVDKTLFTKLFIQEIFAEAVALLAVISSFIIVVTAKLG